MDKINIVCVVFKDNRELVVCATTDKVKANKASELVTNTVYELSQEKVADLQSKTSEEFDDDYEDFLFSKELAENFLTVKITQVPLNSLYNIKL